MSATERENLKPVHEGEKDRESKEPDGQKKGDRKKEKKNDTRKTKRQKKCAESYCLICILLFLEFK